MKADARGNTSSLNEQPMLRGDDMSSFQNNAPVQNQAGPQVINGNVTFNNYGAQHRRSRIGYDGKTFGTKIDNGLIHYAAQALPQSNCLTTVSLPIQYSTFMWTYVRQQTYSPRLHFPRCLIAGGMSSRLIVKAVNGCLIWTNTGPGKQNRTVFYGSKAYLVLANRL